MRDWLRKGGLNRQPIVLALLGLGLTAVIAVGLFATYSRVPKPVEPVAEPPHRGGPVQYTVIEGEVLWQIAEQYGLRPETVLWANDLEDPDLLLVGQLLLIPPADGVLYTVRPGDRL